jgi:hypothetical protein
MIFCPTMHLSIKMHMRDALSSSLHIICSGKCLRWIKKRGKRESYCWMRNESLKFNVYICCSKKMCTQFKTQSNLGCSLFLKIMLELNWTFQWHCNLDGRLSNSRVDVRLCNFGPLRSWISNPRRTARCSLCRNAGLRDRLGLLRLVATLQMANLC